MEYTGEVSYGDKHSVGRNNKIVKVRLKRKDKITEYKNRQEYF